MDNPVIESEIDLSQAATSDEVAVGFLNQDFSSLDSEKGTPSWSDLSSFIGVSHDDLTRRIDAIMALSESKTVALSKEFQNLAKTAAEQGDYLKQLITIAQVVQVGNSQVSIQDISSLLHQTFLESISAMLEISKQAMMMVYILNDGIKNLKEIEKSIRQIEVINHKTKYLSINATIEAVRAGEAGESFQVVASEVRDLSNDTQRLAVSIRGQVNQMTETLDYAQDILQKVASIDMSGNILAKERLDDMMRGLINNSETISNIVNDATRTSQEFSDSARKLITDIQYQDRVRQDLESMHQSLATIHTTVERLRPALGDSQSDDLQQSIQRIIDALPPGMDGDIHKVVQEKQPFSAGMEVNDSKASDDIELF